MFNNLQAFEPYERWFDGGIDLSYSLWERHSLFAQYFVSDIKNRRFTPGDNGVGHLIRLEGAASARATEVACSGARSRPCTLALDRQSTAAHLDRTLGRGGSGTTACGLGGHPRESASSRGGRSGEARDERLSVPRPPLRGADGHGGHPRPP